MSGFMEFDLGNTQDAIKKPVSNFKVEDGKSYRVSLAWWAPLDGGKLDFEGNPKFIKAARYYKQGLGYVIHDESIGDELKKLMGENPKERFATILVQWKTSDDGTLDNDAFAQGRDFKVLPWIMSQEKLTDILRVHKNFGISEVDVSITCPKGGAQYQKMTIMPINRSFKNVKHGNLLRLAFDSDDGKMKQLADSVFKEVARLETEIRGQIGRNYTLNEIREKLGMTVAPSGDVNAGADDADAILDNLMPWDQK